MIRYMFKTKLYKKYNKMLQTKINYLVFFVFTTIPYSKSLRKLRVQKRKNLFVKLSKKN